MKWGKVIQQNTVWDWRTHYISYKQLKKIIKKLRQALDTHNNEKFDELQGQFTELLQKNLDDVDSFYTQRETQLLTHLDSLETDEKSSELYELEKYAYLNGEGFRKILKKYDKKLSLNASTEYVNIIQSKPFYSHNQISTVHASLSNNYKPVCELGTQLLNECDCNDCEYFDYDLINIFEANLYDLDTETDSKSHCLKQFCVKYFQISHHYKICAMHSFYVFIILCFIVLSFIDIIYTFSFKGDQNWNYLSQKVVFKKTSFKAFMFPLLIFCLCSLIALMVFCGNYQTYENKRKMIKTLSFIILSPLILTLLFGLSPIIIIVLTLLLIDCEGYKSLMNNFNVSYEVMFMKQVNTYYYNNFLKENTELIAHNYYNFNFMELRILFLCILHLYRNDNERMQQMYFEIISKLTMEHRHNTVWKCATYFEEIFVPKNEFYFAHSNADQRQSTWLSLLTSFQSYCVLFFGTVCFHYILWWISFGWSSYSLFANFQSFSKLLQFWGLRDGVSSLLCVICVWLRHRYMYYAMKYDYSWLNPDLRHLILDSLVIHSANNGNSDGDNNGRFIRRNMTFRKRFFDDTNNGHCEYVLTHLMPILRQETIEKTLFRICFDQFWMVDIIMTYLPAITQMCHFFETSQTVIDMQ